ncbi:MAG: fatty acid cis/trans isomerase [Nitrospira sp.]|nr:fatty acid cis/trans isomerase [Nitrospira sp.]
MEGEFNFLMLLPGKERERERDFWYRDAHQSVKDYVYGIHEIYRRIDPLGAGLLDFNRLENR